MKTTLHLLVLLSLTCAPAVRAQTNEDPMVNYQVILDRVPFGIVPKSKIGHGALGFGRYAFVGLVSPDGISSNRVAVIHDRQTNYYHFKAEGEQIDDIKVMRLESAGTGRRLYLQRGADVMTLTYAQEVHQGGAQLNPFGPPPAIVTSGEATAADKKAAARERAEKAKQERNDASKRKPDDNRNKKEKPVKTRPPR